MRKWYYELPAIVVVTVVAITVLWNMNFGTQPAPTEKKQDFKTETFVVKRDTLYTKWNNGKSLFKANCAACHNPKVDGTGPALQGVTARWNAAGKFKGRTGEQWLRDWIRNYNVPVSAGYRYAIDMANSRPSAMNIFGTIKDSDIDAIIFYVENASSYQRSVAGTVVN